GGSAHDHEPCRCSRAWRGQTHDGVRVGSQKPILGRPLRRTAGCAADGAGEHERHACALICQRDFFQIERRLLVVACSSAIKYVDAWIQFKGPLILERSDAAIEAWTERYIAGRRGCDTGAT